MLVRDRIHLWSRERMEKELLEYDVDSLRYDDLIRDKIATAAEDILAKVKEFAL